MRQKTVFFVFLLFFYASFYIFSQEKTLTLDEAVSLAVKNNLSLKKTEIDLAASGYSQKFFWSEIFPAINANASVGYRWSPFSDPPQTGSYGLNYSIGLGLRLDLNAGIFYTIKNIQLAHQANILRYEDACNQLSIQITKIFYSLVAEKNNLLFLEEVFSLAQRQYSRSETMFRNGFVGELSLTQSRLALENARYSLNAAKIAHNNNMSEFCAILGISVINNIILSGEISLVRIEADSGILIEKYLPLRPDIIRSSQEIERLAMSEKVTFWQNRGPSLNLSVNWSSSAFDPFTDSLSATAAVTIPVDSWIQGTSRYQSLSKAQDTLEKAKIDLIMAENSAKTQISSLSALLHNSWDSILIARLSLEAATRSYELTEQAFNNGRVESLVLENARNNMTNARGRLIQTEFSYFNMILDLSAALNISWKNLIENYGVAGE